MIRPIQTCEGPEVNFSGLPTGENHLTKKAEKSVCIPGTTHHRTSARSTSPHGPAQQECRDDRSFNYFPQKSASNIIFSEGAEASNLAC